MAREADRVVRLVSSGERPDESISVVGDQVITSTPADAGKVVTVDADGVLVLGDGGEPVNTDAVRYVSKGSLASDSNEGLTPQSPKATIAAAVDSLPATGGVVRPLYGTFVEGTTAGVAAITIKDRVVIDGLGDGLTTVKLADGIDAPLFETEDWATLSTGDTQGGPAKWAIRRLDIDGNSANNLTTAIGIRAYGYDFDIEGVSIRNTRGGGIVSQWSSLAGAPSPDSMEARVSGVTVHDNLGGVATIDWNGPHDSRFHQLVVFDIGAASVKGIRFGPKGTGMQCSDVHVWGTGHTHAWYVESTGNYLTGCEGEGASIGNLVILANDTMVTGGHYFGGGVIGSKGIVIGAAGLPVAGCKIDTKVTSCTAGAVDFANDAGNQVEVACYQESGSAALGTRSIATRGYQSVVGGATGAWTSLPGDVTVPNGDLVIDGAGKGLKIDVTSGNAKMGEATLVDGKVQIFTSAITNDSYVFVTRRVPGGTLGAGGLHARNPGGTDRAAGAWFFVSSLDTLGSVVATDTSSFYWLLIEPS